MTTTGLKSEDKMRMSHRNGARGTIYGVTRRDSLNNKDILRDKNEVVFPFKAGSKYKGEWKDDMKCGFGTEIYPDGSSYSGQWLEDKRHGRGTLWIIRKKKSVHQYVGEWFQGEKDGYGIFYYENGDEYKGDWKHGQRSGSGRQDYANGDYYVGDWENDSRTGFGSYHYDNGNLFEGVWMNDRKEGRGRFFYASTKKVYEGEWVDDQPRCGEFREPIPNELSRFGNSNIRRETFTLPEIGLKDPNHVIELSAAEIRNESLHKRGISDNKFESNIVEEAIRLFDSIDKSRKGAISIFATDKIFEVLGLKLTRDVLKEIMRQVKFEDQPLVSLIDIIDIAACILATDN